MDLARAVHLLAPFCETDGRRIVRLPCVKGLIVKLPELPDLPPFLEKLFIILYFFILVKVLATLATHV